VCETLTESDIASFDAPAYDFLKRLGAAHGQLTALQAQRLGGVGGVGAVGGVGSAGAGGGVGGVGEVDAVLAALQCNALELISDLTWSYTRSDGVLCDLPGMEISIKPMYIPIKPMY
jgi:hypothetical protein